MPAVLHHSGTQDCETCQFKNFGLSYSITSRKRLKNANTWHGSTTELRKTTTTCIETADLWAECFDRKSELLLKDLRFLRRWLLAILYSTTWHRVHCYMGTNVAQQWFPAFFRKYLLSDPDQLVVTEPRKSTDTSLTANFDTDTTISKWDRLHMPVVKRTSWKLVRRNGGNRSD